MTRPSAFRLDQLWQAAVEPTFWLDQGLRIAWVNHAWESLTGHDAEAVLGVPCPSFGPRGEGGVAELAAAPAPPAEAMAGRPAGNKTLILAAGGDRLWRRVEFWPFCNSQGELIGLLGRVRDPADLSDLEDSRAQDLRVRLMEARERSRTRYGIDDLVGSGAVHDRILEQIRLAASSRAHVLIVGEPGTGRRLVAGIIHQLGPLREGPLIRVDCEALTADLLESRLFPAAPTGGTRGAAPPNNGRPHRTLPFDEGSSLILGDVLALPRDLQARLAESLDGRVRLLAITAGDPEAAFARHDLIPALYHVLGVLVIRIPPLRARRDDIPLLAQEMMERLNRRVVRQRTGFTPRAISALLAYDWPGNVGELARVVDHAHSRPTTEPGAVPDAPRERDGRIDVDDLPASIRGNLGAGYLPPAQPGTIRPLDELLTEIERKLIEAALAKARQNKSKAAEQLGISRPRLYRRIKELNLPDVDVEPTATEGGSSHSSPKDDATTDS